MAAPSAQSTSPFTVARRLAWRATDCDPIDLDPIEAARAAGLRYVTGEEAGFRRRKRGSSFAYVGVDGERVEDKSDLARIKAIVIPPAWTDVWICVRSNGHLQATGRDDRGRKQYRYHPAWRSARDDTKYGRLLEFGRCLPGIRSQVESDLRLAGLPRQKVIAAVVSLLERTLIRVGNEEYARSNGSHGLTTLRDDHVEIDGGSMQFVFRGKSGKDHTIGLRDRRLTAIVRRCRDIPGQTLFQYLDDAGVSHSVGSGDVNNYLRDVCGQEYTAKDIRTWSGTLLAANALAGTDPAESEREQTRQIARVVETVAERLGNTPSVCRKCYIHPLVIDAFRNGRLSTAVIDAGRLKGYSADEIFVLNLLESEKAHADQ